jgi:DNA-binding MarR family transcriptional regulator
MEGRSNMEEAEKIALLMPALMRQMFTLDDDLSIDLPLAQLRVCAMLRDGPRPMSLLGKELGVSLSAMTQIADRLERAKLVSRVGRENDRRVRCLELTRHGEKIMHRREQSRIQNVSAVLKNVSGSARKEIVAAMEILMKASMDLKAENTSVGSNGDGSRQRHNKLVGSKVSR